jgi:transposase-like protein
LPRLPKYKCKKEMIRNRTGHRIICAKKCGRQFTGYHALWYKGCHSSLTQKMLLMLVRGVGIRDIAEIENISIKKVV